MLRRMKCSKQNELWFLVEGKPIWFSLRECAIVSGLRYSDKVDITGEQVAKWGYRLCNLYFESNTTIKFDDLAWGFRKMSETANKVVKKKDNKGNKKKYEPKARYRRERGDRVNVALIYFLESVLFSLDAKWNVSFVYERG